MVDTPTTTYGLLKPQVGASSDTWGTTINADLDAIDDLLDGTTAIAPNLTANAWKIGGVAVTATAAELNILDGLTATTAELNSVSTNAMPSGGIIMWSGSLVSIPSAWLLCDGTNGTPDLRNRFIVGAGSGYAVAAIGGADSVTLSSANMPAHTHTFSATTSSNGSHSHTIASGTNADGSSPRAISTSTGSSTTSVAGDHTHTVSGTTASAGSGTAHENRPPYYALAYIMKS